MPHSQSMENLESVVHERNDAVLRLETGDSASPPMRTVTSFAGFTYQYVLLFKDLMCGISHTPALVDESVLWVECKHTLM